MQMPPAMRNHAAAHVHDAGAGEVDRAVAEAEVLAELREPAAAPDPVAVDGVGEHAHPEAVDDEVPEVPAFGHTPVGMVAVVSMNTISKRKSVKTAVSKTDGFRKKPFRPSNPNGCPAIVTVQP